MFKFAASAAQDALSFQQIVSIAILIFDRDGIGLDSQEFGGRRAPRTNRQQCRTDAIATKERTRSWVQEIIWINSGSLP